MEQTAQSWVLRVIAASLNQVNPSIDINIRHKSLFNYPPIIHQLELQDYKWSRDEIVNQIWRPTERRKYMCRKARSNDQNKVVVVWAVVIQEALDK